MASHHKFAPTMQQAQAYTRVQVSVVGQAKKTQSVVRRCARTHPHQSCHSTHPLPMPPICPV
jgi:hypothetical protein